MRSVYPPHKSPLEERFIGLPGETQVPVRRLEMVYDAQGRRVSKKLMTNVRNANGTLVNAAWAFQRETIFLWQDWMLLAEFVRLTEAGSPALRRSYLWGLDVSGTLEGAGGVGGLLWVADHVPGLNGGASTRQLAPCYDGNGNILSWVENEGAELLPLHRLEYDPFGQTLVDDPARVARTKKQSDLQVPDVWLDRPAFGFSTKYEDRETGLLYYGYRYYNPELGRWLSRDPIDEEGGINLYGMVGNDPVNQWDYLGRSVGVYLPPTAPHRTGIGWPGPTEQASLPLAVRIGHLVGFHLAFGRTARAWGLNPTAKVHSLTDFQDEMIELLEDQSNAVYFKHLRKKIASGTLAMKSDWSKIQLSQFSAPQQLGQGSLNVWSSNSLLGRTGSGSKKLTNESHASLAHDSPR